VVPIVVDTNVFVAGLRSGGGASRQVLRGCLQGDYEPLFGPALLSEYEYSALLNELEPDDVRIVLQALVSVGRWVNVYYLWRPNLRDETDNHLIELAVSGAAVAVVTHNVRDLAGGELRFPSLRILTPAALLREYPCRP
jgi:putative PIN family toxin of toxin-antitoxin system